MHECYKGQKGKLPSPSSFSPLVPPSPHPPPPPPQPFTSKKNEIFPAEIHSVPPGKKKRSNESIQWLDHDLRSVKSAINHYLTITYSTVISF